MGIGSWYGERQPKIVTLDINGRRICRQSQARLRRLTPTRPGLPRLNNSAPGLPSSTDQKIKRVTQQPPALRGEQPRSDRRATCPPRRRQRRRSWELLTWRKRGRRRALSTRRTLTCAQYFSSYFFFANVAGPTSSINSCVVLKIKQFGIS